MNFSPIWRGGVAKLDLPSWVASMVSVVVLDPEYLDVSSLLSVLALVLGGGRIAPSYAEFGISLVFGIERSRNLVSFPIAMIGVCA